MLSLFLLARRSLKSLRLRRLHTYSVSKRNLPWGFLAFFPKRLGIFRLNFTRLLCVPIYAILQIIIQLSATLMKLCHIKRDHPVHIICAKCSLVDRRVTMTVCCKQCQTSIRRHFSLSTLFKRCLYRHDAADFVVDRNGL